MKKQIIFTKESEIYKAGKKLTTVLEVERFVDSLEIEMSNTNQHGCLIWLSVEEGKQLAEFLTGWQETMEATGAATEPRYTADQIEAAMIAVDDALDLGDEPVTAQRWRQLVMERLSGNST